MALKELKIEAVLHKIKLRTYLLLIKPIQYVYLHVFSVYISWVMILNLCIKITMTLSLKNAKLCLMCGFIHGFVQYFNLFTIYRSFNWIYVVSHYFDLPPNCSNRAFFIRLLQSLVPSVRRKKARRSECDLICLGLET